MGAIPAWQFVAVFPMNETTRFLIDHGQVVLFLVILVEQMGLPIPAFPWLLAAGALSAGGKFSFHEGVLVTVLACLAADTTWFYIGRLRGSQVLRWLCRISLEPDSCVRRTQNVFTKYGLRGLLVARFVPGMATVAPPLAGMSKIPLWQFLLVEAAGSLIYGISLLGIGFFFSHQIDQIAAAVSRISGSALALLAIVVVLFVAAKFWRRQRLLHELRMARITVTELRELVSNGNPPVILDLRSAAAVTEDPAMIQGAIHMSLDDLGRRLHEFPKDRDIVVYCSCPNEASSARFALELRRKGFTRIRPLLGGLDAWRELGTAADKPGARTTDTITSGA